MVLGYNLSVQGALSLLFSSQAGLARGLTHPHVTTHRHQNHGLSLADSRIATLNLLCG